MPAHTWWCLACGTLNPAEVSACSACGCLGNASGKEVAALKARARGESTSKDVQEQPPLGHSFGTYLLVALFALGGLHGLWQSVFGIAVPRGAPSGVEDYAANLGLADKLLRSIYALFCFGIAWLLFRLKRSVITLSWVYAGVTSLALLVQLALDQKIRSAFASLYWVPLSLPYVTWAVIFWYLYRVRGQGRLGT